MGPALTGRVARYGTRGMRAPDAPEENEHFPFFLNGRGVSKDPELLHSKPVGTLLQQGPPKK
jgi:hypothetical protein